MINDMDRDVFMKLPIYQVDAFTSHVFGGNPAAVCPLTEWLPDATLQKIAQENNLSETAFFVTGESPVQLRWFTPAEEVDLCGHATLATAYVMYEYLNYKAPSITFMTKSGELNVTQHASGFSMDFPASMPTAIDAPAPLLKGLGQGIEPVNVMAAFDYIVVLKNEAEVRRLQPDFSQWLTLDLRGVVVTALSDDANESTFVSRCFFPKLNVNEDPVTGSAQCELAPYWERELLTSTLVGQQVSQRGGTVLCEMNNDRVVLTGSAASYMVGEISI